MPLRKKNKSTSSLNRRPKPLSREKQRLKDLEDGFNTWNPERLKEYDPFQDGNMRTYFTTKTVRKVLLDKGIIKAQTSPDGKVARYIVNDEMPKNIFFTKKSPEEIARAKNRLPAIKRTETPILSLADSEMVERTFQMLNEAMHKKMSKPIEVFRAIDIDESGEVTYKELRDGLREQLDLTFSDDEFSSLVATVDRDGSGDIEYKELVKQMKKHDGRRKELLNIKVKSNNLSLSPINADAKTQEDIDDGFSSKYGEKMEIEEGKTRSRSNSTASMKKNDISQLNKISVQERMKELDQAVKNPNVAENFYQEGQAFLNAKTLKAQKQVKINLKASAGKAKKKQLSKGMVADFLNPDSNLSQLYAREKRKVGFSIGTYGELKRRDRQRREARRYKKRVSSRPRVPTQEKPPSTPRDVVHRRKTLESMKRKIDDAVDHIDEIEAEEERRPADYYKKEQDRLMRNLRSHIDLKNLHEAVAPYVGDFFGTRGDYFEGQMYMSRMTPAKEHKSKNPWDFDSKQAQQRTLTPSEIPGINAKRSCAVALCGLSYDAGNRESLIEEGSIPALVDLSAIEDSTIRLCCSVAFHNLSRCKKVRASMLDDNAIPALLHLLSANVEDKVTMLHCIYALCNLSCVPGYEKFLMRHGVLKAATLIAKSDDDSLIEPAITILYNLTVTAGEVFDDLSEILVQDIIHLAMLQEHKEDQGESVKRYAYIFARALCNLTRLVRLRARMVTEGIILAFTPLLELKDELISKFCIVGITNLSQAEGELRRTCIRHGAIDILLKICKGKDETAENKERGIVALSNLCRKSKETETTRRILPIILSLSHSDDEDSWERCTTALNSLSQAKNNRFLLVKTEAVQIAIRILQSLQKKYAQTTVTEENCVKFLCNLILDKRSRALALEKEVVPALLPCLRTQSTNIMNILSSVFNVLCGDPRSKSAVSTEEALIAFLAMAELGNSRTKGRASAALSVLSETNVSQIMIRLADKVFGVLINLLGTKDGRLETIRYAVVTMAQLAKTKEMHLRVANEAMSALVPLASSDDRETKIWLITLLCKLSFTEGAAVKMCQSGACVAISLLSRLNDDDSEYRCSVALQNMSAFTLCRSRMMQDGAVITTLALSASHFEETRFNCVKVICNLACIEGAESELMKQKVLPELMILALVRANTSKTKVACAAAMVNMLVKDTATEMILEGLIWCLTQLASLPSELLVKAAASAFATIVENDDSRKTLIASDKGINSLMSLMRTESRKTRELCWQTFGRICLDKCEMRLVQEGVLDVLSELVAGDDYMLKRNSGAILALLCENPDTRLKTVKQAMHLLSNLAKDSGLEPARQFCSDALHALSKDKATRALIVDLGVMDVLTNLLNVSESPHTNQLCLHSLYNITTAFKGAEKFCDPQIIAMITKLNKTSEPMTGDMLMAIIRALSWSEKANFDDIVYGGIVKTMMLVLKDGETMNGGNSSTSTIRLDCAIACRNLSRKCSNATLDRLIDDGILDLLKICMKTTDNINMKRYVGQTICYLSVSQYSREVIVNVNQYVSVLVEFLKAGSLPLQRETLCTLHYLALDQDHVNILLEEGVYDIATKLGSHSDIKIKRSCKSILQLLSQTVKTVNTGTVSRIIELSLSETDNTLDCRTPYGPSDACYEAIEDDDWESNIKSMESNSKGFGNATKPTMLPLPFCDLGTEFKAPPWERVSWPTTPREPHSPASAVLKQEDEKELQKLTAGSSDSATKEENILEGSELGKGEPKAPHQFDNENSSQNLDSIVQVLEKFKSTIHRVVFVAVTHNTTTANNNNDDAGGKNGGGKQGDGSGEKESGDDYLDDSFESEKSGL